MRRLPSVLLLSFIVAVSAVSAGASVGPEQKLTNSVGAASDEFGRSIAIDGLTIVVAANETPTYMGAVYLFEPDQGDWFEVVKLTSSDADASDRFGTSVALSADTLVAGAVGDDDFGSNSGAAYIFERDAGGSGSWGEVLKIVSSDIAFGHMFGMTAAIDGDTLVVGANNEAVYVFERDLGGSGNWGEVAKLTASDSPQPSFGQSVALDGDVIVVGASLDDQIATGAGAAYIYERDLGGPDNWGESKKVTAADGADFDQFGKSVSVDGGELLVGMFSDDEPFHKSGSAYIFERDLGGLGNWGQRQKIQASDAGDVSVFGWAVSIADGLAVSGAYLDKTPTATGSAYLYSRNWGGTNNWGEVTKLLALDKEAGDAYGFTVAVNQHAVVIGSQSKGPNTTGAVYVYPLSANAVPALSWGLPLAIAGLAAIALLKLRRTGVATSLGSGS